MNDIYDDQPTPPDCSNTQAVQTLLPWKKPQLVSLALRDTKAGIICDAQEDFSQFPDIFFGSGAFNPGFCP